MGALNDPAAWTTSAHGEIPSCIEIKLVDFEDAGYLVTNKPKPQGEIWVRGDSVMEGYWQDEEATKEAIAPGGYVPPPPLLRANPLPKLSNTTR